MCKCWENKQYLVWDGDLLVCLECWLPPSTPDNYKEEWQ